MDGRFIHFHCHLMQCTFKSNLFDWMHLSTWATCASVTCTQHQMSNANIFCKRWFSPGFAFLHLAEPLDDFWLGVHWGSNVCANVDHICDSTASELGPQQFILNCAVLLIGLSLIQFECSANDCGHQGAAIALVEADKSLDAESHVHSMIDWHLAVLFLCTQMCIRFPNAFSLPNLFCQNPTKSKKGESDGAFANCQMTSNDTPLNWFSWPFTQQFSQWVIHNLAVPLFQKIPTMKWQRQIWSSEMKWKREHWMWQLWDLQVRFEFAWGVSQRDWVMGGFVFCSGSLLIVFGVAGSKAQSLPKDVTLVWHWRHTQWPMWMHACWPMILIWLFHSCCWCLCCETKSCFWHFITCCWRAMHQPELSSQTHKAKNCSNHHPHRLSFARAFTDTATHCFCFFLSICLAWTLTQKSSITKMKSTSFGSLLSHSNATKGIGTSFAFLIPHDVRAGRITDACPSHTHILSLITEVTFPFTQTQNKGETISTKSSFWASVMIMNACILITITTMRTTATLYRTS